VPVPPPPQPSKEGSNKASATLHAHTYLLLASMFLIYAFEKDGARDDPVNFSIFNLMFEIIR
jgi:hypothetical protein